MCVQEKRWEGQSAREVGQGFKLFYTGSGKRNRVGIILEEELKKQVINVQRVSDRLMMAKIIVDTEVVNIVSAYAPQQGCNTLEKEEFLGQFEDLIKPVIRSEKCFIGADLNGHVGEKKDGFEGVHGGFGFGKRNKKGKKILHFAQGLDLSIVKTNFKKKKEHNITYKRHPYASQIDYILTRKEDAKEVKDCKVILGEQAVKQQQLMITDIRSRPSKKSKRPAAMKRIRTWKLKDRISLFHEDMSKETQTKNEIKKETRHHSNIMHQRLSRKATGGKSGGQKQMERIS